ncbi:MAG: sulfite exporter TauE/SafE family protein [Rothia sp. (in: high G+C Gram-positive bacteria)]|nr:sulfite exporter TauE/SafE family protein [Rothia sp. (in: high G+C Gram-positive bacteria)]
MLADPTLNFLIIMLAGATAGFINSIVGSGTLISFPLLLLLGYPPLTANVSSSVGLVAGNISGALGYRREIKDNLSLVKMLLPSSILGGICGAGLLLVLPESAFDFIVPILVGLGLLMVVLGPVIQRKVAASRAEKASAEPLPVLAHRQEAAVPVGGRRIAAIVIVFLLGVYGGYFGAAQGMLMIGFLGVLLTVSLQSLNAVKNLLVSAVNILSAVIFMIFAGSTINWFVVLAIALGAAVGGFAGAKIGRRLSPNLLRGVILVIGTIALINLIFNN